MSLSIKSQWYRTRIIKHRRSVVVEGRRYRVHRAVQKHVWALNMELTPEDDDE